MYCGMSFVGMARTQSINPSAPKIPRASAEKKENTNGAMIVREVSSVIPIIHRFKGGRIKSVHFLETHTHTHTNKTRHHQL